MVTQDAAEPTEFPPQIGRPACRALALNGYTRYDQLTSVTSAELSKIHGVGPKAIRILEQELAARARLRQLMNPGRHSRAEPGEEAATMAADDDALFGACPGQRAELRLCGWQNQYGCVA